MQESSSSQNNKRIAKNTLMLYIRMGVTLFLSLYTSRVVLNTLGVEDFGIYNIVGGVVMMLSFLNNSMSMATQRFLSYEIAKNNIDQLQKIFSTSLLIHITISFFVLILAETLGLYFLNNYLVIPPDRMFAARWVYQFSVFAAILLIMAIPYNALIIAQERMVVFAYITIVDVVMRLLIVLCLSFIFFDKLIMYSFLILCVTILVQLVYWYYCRREFNEIKSKFYWDKSLFTIMMNFAGWNLFGNFAAVAFTQGLNILLNIFFGPIVNAARGIAVQVQNTINQFALNIQIALNPQIVKSYASENFEYMHSLIFRSTKFTFFLLFLVSLPVLFETEFLLKLWLKLVPDYTIVFLRLMLIVIYLDTLANPLMVSAQATGKIKVYQVCIGGILLLIPFISYIVLRFGYPPQCVFIIHIIIAIIAQIIRFLLIYKRIGLSLRNYLCNAILPILAVSTISVILPFIFSSYYYQNDLFRFIIVCISCFVPTLLAIYFLGLSKNERFFLQIKIKKILKR